MFDLKDGLPLSAKVRTVFLESCPNKVSPNLGRDKRPKLESAFQTWVRFDDGVSPNVKYNSLCAFLPLQKTIKHTVKQMMMVILVPATAITMIVENDSSCPDVKVSDKQKDANFVIFVHVNNYFVFLKFWINNVKTFLHFFYAYQFTYMYFIDIFYIVSNNPNFVFIWFEKKRFTRCINNRAQMNSW